MPQLLRRGLPEAARRVADTSRNRPCIGPGSVCNGLGDVGCEGGLGWVPTPRDAQRIVPLQIVLLGTTGLCQGPHRPSPTGSFDEYYRQNLVMKKIITCHHNGDKRATTDNRPRGGVGPSTGTRSLTSSNLGIEADADAFPHDLARQSSAAIT